VKPIDWIGARGVLLRALGVPVWLLAGISTVWALVPNPATDLDSNGLVNSGDLLSARNCMLAYSKGQPLPAKCPAQDPEPAGGGDGDWDMADYSEVRANLGQIFPPEDSVAPIVEIETPADGAALSATPVRVHGAVDDTHITVQLELTNASGTVRVTGFGGGTGRFFDVPAAPLAPGVNRLTVLVSDLAGNVGSDTVTVTYVPPDTAPPQVAVSTPAEGAVLHESPIEVRGTVDDAAARISVNGVAAAVQGGGFVASGVGLSPGPNTLTVSALDPAGNLSRVEVHVTYQPDVTPPLVSIGGPADGAVLLRSPVTVTGSVDDPGAAVTVNGVSAAAAQGGFSAQVPLTLGENSIEARAVDQAGNVATARIRVTYAPDLTAPTLVIASPYSGAVVDTPTLAVTGTVDDATASVTVNGAPAVVGQGSFTATGVVLSEGSNEIRAQATDPAGNASAPVLIRVTFVPPDSTAPVATLEGGTADRFTAQPDILLGGTASDDRGAVTVRVHTEAFGGADFAAPLEDGQWTVRVPLQAGANRLEVRVSDGAGNRRVLALTVERESAVSGLEIRVDYPPHGAVLDASPIMVRGTLHTDLRALSQGVRVNGLAGTLSATALPTETAFETPALALTDGLNSLLVAAYADDATAQQVVQVQYLPAAADLAAPQLSILSPVPGSTLAQGSFLLVGEVRAEAGLTALRIDGQPLAFVGTIPGPYRFSGPYAFAQGASERRLSIEAVDTKGHSTTLIAVYSLDTEPPALALDRPLQAAPAVSPVDQSPYPLSGTLSDADLAGFSIAGQPLGLSPGVSAGTWRFSANLSLAAGSEQEVELSAVDRAGNRTERIYILRADSVYALSLLVPAADQVLALDPAGGTMPVSVRIDGVTPEGLTALLLDASGATLSHSSIGGSGALRGASLPVPAAAGVYRLEVRALDADGAIRARVSRRIELVAGGPESLALESTDPAAGAAGVEPNAPLTLYFNGPIDPAKVTLSVRETAHGETYVDADPPGTDALQARGYTLAAVDRTDLEVPGGLSLLPGDRTLVFYPERDLAYDAEVLVELAYDGAPLASLAYRTRPLPTFLSGTVLDLFGQPVAGVPVVLGEGDESRRTETDSGGGFAFGFGDSAAQSLASGRQRLDLNPGMTLAGWGSRRQWVSVEAARRNELGTLRLAQLNPDVPPVPAAGGDDLSLLGGDLKLDLTQATLLFPDGRESGDLYAQFLSYSQIPYPIAPLAVPLYLYGLHPAGVEPSGAVALDLGVPALGEGFEHLPPEGVYVVLLGLDRESGQVVPIGAGQVEGHRVKSRGVVQLRVLDLVGWALAGPQHQDALAAYAAGTLPLVRLLAVLGR
jgi:hypothetical protein